MAKNSKQSASIDHQATQRVAQAACRPGGHDLALPRHCRPGDKQDAAAMTDALAPELSDLQERLFAVGRLRSLRARES